MPAAPDSIRAGRGMEAMFGMVEVDRAGLQAAHDGRMVAP